MRACRNRILATAAIALKRTRPNNRAALMQQRKPAIILCQGLPKTFVGGQPFRAFSST
jgi:hypothetical protein